MLRWSLLLLALAIVTLGSLTIVKSPDWSEWKLALLAGEYGHWLALLAVAIGALAWAFRGPSPHVAVATALVCALALGLLTRPCLEAWKIGGALPARFRAQFGATDGPSTAFSLIGLFSTGPRPMRVETFSYAAGLSIDYYFPPGKTAAPCVVLVHGGGWDGGSRAELAHFNQWLASIGYAVAAIDYRLAPTAVWPAQRDDTLAAVAYLKAHATELRLDPARLVLLGRSAGGNIAEAVGYSANDPAIRGVIALYAPADLHFAWQYARDDDVLKSPVLLKQFLGGTPATARPAYDGASPYWHVGPSTPPTLLLHGKLDTLVWYRQSERLDARLTEQGVRHIFVSLPWATHAFEYNLAGPGGQLTRYAVEHFLTAVTQQP